MGLANGAGPRAAFSRLAPMVLGAGSRLAPMILGAGLLAGCQSAGQAPPPEARAASWRVVERVGEARYLAPGASSWAAALPATALPDGSRVATGGGGRLILARASDHLSAGPGSQFSLPAAATGGALQQTAGRLRYRLTQSPSLAVATPAFAIQGDGGAFEVTVGGSGAEVAVERGRLRVATPDGERGIELEAGQSARADSREALAFRRAAGQPLEPVEPIMLPALQPRPTLAGSPPPEPALMIAGAAGDRAASSAAASIESAVPIATATPRLSPTAPIAPATAAPPAASGALPAIAPAGVPAPPLAVPFTQAVVATRPEVGLGQAAGSRPAPVELGQTAGPRLAPGESGQVAGSRPAPVEFEQATGSRPAPVLLGQTVVARPAPVEFAQVVAQMPATVEVEPATDAAPGDRSVARSHGAAAPAGAHSTAAVTGGDRRSLFDRLTEGMIEALPAQPAHPRL